jgi:glycosyltransferase involved in cell wall biosynthesis
MEHDLVTTILPVFNRPQMLRRAVESVLAQTWRPVEVIVVDDGSTDDTGATADELAAAHPEIRVIHQRNQGVGRARETGRLAARGEFIQHLDSDDLLLPRKFELQVAALRDHPECDVSYGWTRGRRPDGSEIEGAERRTGERIEAMFPAMLASRLWQTVTPLYRRSIINRAGAWLPLKNEEDWEYDARIASLGVRLAYCPEWVAEFHHHEGERLSARGMTRDGLRDRARAHSLILDHALRGGVPIEGAEMRRYARELFLLARQTGAAGLTEESMMLFIRAREASGTRGDGADFRAYALGARILGWTLVGRLACLSDRLR